MTDKKQKVFVGLSGGVDSSVAALRLLRAGYNVVGVFIKTWQPDFIQCDWEKERLDAMRVAAHLDIPFLTCDAEKTYKDDVAKYMIDEYKAGRTPNPDVMCNKYVKFDAFLDFALQHGADKIATGHYAQVKEEGLFHMYRGTDANKDQSYFLWTLTQGQLSKTLFPIGVTSKDKIRQEAKEAGLPTFSKQDSQGVCFLGDINMKQFLSHYIDVEEGKLLNMSGKSIGKHDGVIFYTLGQRHGFMLDNTQSNSEAYYVISKNLKENTVTVSNEKPVIHNNQILLTNLHAISKKLPSKMQAQFRYRQKPFNVTLERIEAQHGILTVQEENIDMPSYGQSCVFYNKEECLGGGVIESSI